MIWAFGQDRGAECVDVRDDTGTGRFPDEKNTCQLSAADDDKNFEGEGADRVPKTCDTVVRDTHCVCKKPDNPAHLGNLGPKPFVYTCSLARPLHTLDLLTSALLRTF